VTKPVANHSQRIFNVSIYITRPLRGDERNEQNITRGQLVLGMTKRLTDQSLQSIALDRATVLARNGHAKPGMIESIASTHDLKAAAAQTPAGAHGRKLRAPQQAPGFGERIVQTDRRLRPLARRRLMIARPERVAMRARKP